MTSLLDGILASTREDVARRRARHPDPAADSSGLRHAGAFRKAIAGVDLAIIAEHKRRSPSAGAIRSGASVTEIVQAYERGGAAALSILTEQRNFGGSLKDLSDARAVTGLPILRKDFIIDTYQLGEAVAAGADAVLLIVAALSGTQLAELHAAAGQLGLDVLVEVHDAEELETALTIGPAMIGVNNRDLRDFSIDTGRTLELAGRIPADVLLVSESGLDDPAKLLALRKAGVHAALIGETLMRAPDPAGALRVFTAPDL